MSEYLEKDWKSAVTSTISELDKSQYNKLLEILDIPKSHRTDQEKMAQIIIEHYGETSVAVINDAMDRIPRDKAVQDLLRPFRNTLWRKPITGKQDLRPVPGVPHHSPGASWDRLQPPHSPKRRSSSNAIWMTQMPLVSNQQMSHQHYQARTDEMSEIIGPLVETEAPAQRNLIDLDPWLSSRQTSPRRSLQIFPNFQGRNAQPWRKTICDLKSSGELLDTQAIVGKVVHKSELRAYISRDNEEKQLFYLVIADETACIKVLVYGKRRYEEIAENKSYLFRWLQIHENCLKVTSLGKVSETSTVQVPERIEVEAQNLLISETEVCSIAEVRVSDDRTVVSVEGTVTEIDPVGFVKVKHKLTKRKRQNLLLKDITGSIRVSVWGEDTEHCKDILIGDVIKLANMRILHHYDRVSLTSTVFTKIDKVQNAGNPKRKIEIIGVIKTSPETHLEAEMSGRLHTFVVASPLLAEAFHLEQSCDLKMSILEKLPLSANVEIQGSRIHEITAV